MTRILAVGYATGEFLRGQPLIHRIAGTVTREGLEPLVDVIADGLDERAGVIVIYPAWHSDSTLRRLQTVRAALGSPYVLLHPSPLPPLAGSVLCALAAAAAPHVESPGVLMAGLPLLERQLLPVALVRSVTRLRDPAPRLGQHLASWWPPSRFGVSWWPRPQVHTLRRANRSIPLPEAGSWPHLPLDILAVAGASAGDGSEDWMYDVVATRLQVQHVMKVDGEPLAAAYWGTGSVVEAVAYPGNISAVLVAVGYQRGAMRCRWCGELVKSRRCPFCGTERPTVPLEREAA